MQLLLLLLIVLSDATVTGPTATADRIDATVTAALSYSDATVTAPTATADRIVATVTAAPTITAADDDDSTDPTVTAAADRTE